ncbi:MAG: hypothetical protein JW753_02480 [Dehalococcoidia bacterium]|nr:hypothetical protein [Dehalococcoidia bacterium]
MGAAALSDYADIVERAIRPYLPNNSIFPAGQIPPHKEMNARMSCGVPPKEAAMALIDCTVLGSAKNCLMFSSEALYCHSDWSGKSPGTVRIPYHEFPSRVFDDGGFGEVQVGPGEYVNISGCGISKDKMVSILCAIRADIVNGRAAQMIGSGELPGMGCRIAPVPVIAPAPLNYVGIVNQAFHPYLPNSSIYIAGQIPPKKERNARQSCGLRPDEKVVMLVDCTILGSARDCLVFTPETLYCHNAGGSKSPGSIRIPYHEFPSCDFRDVGSWEIQAGSNQYLSVSSCGLSTDKVIAVLCTIRNAVAGSIAASP